MRKLILTLSLAIISANIFAAKVDTIAVYSNSMKRDIMCTVLTPDNMPSGEKLPVVYMLHGHGNDYLSWSNREPVRELVDEYSVIVVSPDGGYNSWYWDSPINPEVRYETFVSSELIKYIDGSYPTIASKEGRAITGLSMGGHGALYLAIRHQDVFSAVGSMSGGVDIRPFPESWQMKEQLGSRDENPDRWFEYSVMGQLELLKPGSLSIIIDCGMADFFREVNDTLHDELERKGISHRYMLAEGAHNWVYWDRSIVYQMLFFKRHFNRETNI